MAVENVSYTNDDAKNGADVTVVNLQKMVMPFTLQVELNDDSKTILKLPVETWLQGNTHTIHLSTTQQIKSVIIDPENKLPDSNRQNNVWKK